MHPGGQHSTANCVYNHRACVSKHKHWGHQEGCPQRAYGSHLRVVRKRLSRKDKGRRVALWKRHVQSPSSISSVPPFPDCGMGISDCVWLTDRNVPLPKHLTP